MGETGASRGHGGVRAADAIRRYLAWIESGEPPDDRDAADVEAGFVRYAAAYSQQRGLLYSHWREAGVPVDVLTRAGIIEFNG